MGSGVWVGWGVGGGGMGGETPDQHNDDISWVKAGLRCGELQRPSRVCSGPATATRPTLCCR